MCGIIVDGIILVAVLTMLTGQDLGSDLVGLLKAGLLALGASLTGSLIAAGMELVVSEFLAQLVGLVGSAIVLGLLITLVYALEPKRALLGVAGYAGIKLAFIIVMILFMAG